MKLLKVAAEIVGGEETLAERLDVTHARMGALLAGRVLLPDRLLLKAVDIILDDRQSRAGPTLSNVYEQPGRI